MLYSYNDCISSFGNDYQIKKSVSNGKLFKICNGIYSDKEYVSELEIVCFKYPMAVFTMDRSISSRNRQKCHENKNSGNKTVFLSEG